MKQLLPLKRLVEMVYELSTVLPQQIRTGRFGILEGLVVAFTASRSARSRRPKLSGLASVLPFAKFPARSVEAPRNTMFKLKSPYNICSHNILTCRELPILLPSHQLLHLPLILHLDLCEPSLTLRALINRPWLFFQNTVCPNNLTRDRRHNIRSGLDRLYCSN